STEHTVLFVFTSYTAVRLNRINLNLRFGAASFTGVHASTSTGLKSTSISKQKYENTTYYHVASDDPTNTTTSRRTSARSSGDL
ncbi:hypothetical protein EUTSA_v10000716mg, partial [Eutrema salsugineum]